MNGGTLLIMTVALSLLWASIAVGTVGNALERDLSSPYTTKRRKVWSAFVGGPILWVMFGMLTLLTVARASDAWARFNAWLDAK